MSFKILHKLSKIGNSLIPLLNSIYSAIVKAKWMARWGEALILPEVLKFECEDVEWRTVLFFFLSPGLLV